MMTTTGGDDGPSVFARYIDGPENARPAPLGNLIKQSRRHADLKTFLMDILMGGPVPVALVIGRGVARGFTKRQITYAREQMQIISFKGPGRGGGWFWVLSHDNRRIPSTAGNAQYLTIFEPVVLWLSNLLTAQADDPPDQ